MHPIGPRITHTTARHAIAHLLAATQSSARTAGAVAESLVYTSVEGDAAHARLSLLLGGTHAKALKADERARASKRAFAERTETARRHEAESAGCRLPALGAVWWRPCAETIERLARAGASRGWFTAPSIEAVLDGSQTGAEAVSDPARRWRLPDARAKAAKAGRIETRVGQIAAALEACRHTMLTSTTWYSSRAGIAVSARAGEETAHMVSTTNTALTAWRLAITGEAQGDWDRNGQPEVVINGLAVPGLKHLLEAAVHIEPCAPAVLVRTGDTLTIEAGALGTVELATIDHLFPSWRHIIPDSAARACALDIDARAAGRMLRAIAKRSAGARNDAPVVALRFEPSALGMTQRASADDAGRACARANIAHLDARARGRSPDADVEAPVEHAVLACALRAVTNGHAKRRTAHVTIESYPQAERVALRHPAGHVALVAQAQAR